MSKLFLLIVIIVAGAAVATGVLEVQVHQDKLASSPGTIMQLASNGILYEKGRGIIVQGKRMIELYSAQTNAQKLEITLGFIRQDAERLEELIAGKPNPEKVIPQANLLAKSITKAREQAKDVPEGELADLQAVTEEAFGKATSALGTLAQLQEDLQESSNELTGVLQEVGVPEAGGDVAGAQDTESSQAETTPEPTTQIPLRF